MSLITPGLHQLLVTMCRRALVLVLGLLFAVVPLVAGPVGTAAGVALAWLPSTAHDAYAYALLTDDMRPREVGRHWVSESEAALLSPRIVEFPHDETADMAGDGSALGYRVAGRIGRRVVADVVVDGAPMQDVFVDVFEEAADQPRLFRSLAAVAPAEDGTRRYSLVWHGLNDSNLVVRVHPALDFDGTVSVSLRDAPLLAFPVAGHSPRSIQSGFGADRDGGRRAHRGVDIFADRGTEVLASLDGWVTRVNTTGRGGNVVWLQPLYGNLRLYYAHLDTQLVEPGQFVTEGDVLGTVGNTGNAITTPPHLHYGVYLRRRGRRGGALDPVDFLK